jgi:hypothetical protein
MSEELLKLRNSMLHKAILLIIENNIISKRYLKIQIIKLISFKGRWPEKSVKVV